MDPRELKVVVCGCARNCVKPLRRSLRRLGRLSSAVGRLDIVLAENDSHDGTDRLAERWDRLGPRHHLIHPDPGRLDGVSTRGQSFFSLKRIETMVRLRNACLDRLDELGLEPDALIWIDLDLFHFRIPDMLAALVRLETSDAVLANGLIPSDDNAGYVYYDTFATRLVDQDGPQSLRRMRRCREQLSRLEPGSAPYRVRSAFGGIGVYRFDTVRGLRYQALENDDPEVGARCEHDTLHAELAARGHAEIYIDPSLRVYHDSRLRRYLKAPEQWVRAKRKGLRRGSVA